MFCHETALSIYVTTAHFGEDSLDCFHGFFSIMDRSDILLSR